MLPALTPDSGRWNRHFVLLPTLGLDVAFQSCCMHFAELDYHFTLRNLCSVLTVLRDLKLGHRKGASM